MNPCSDARVSGFARRNAAASSRSDVAELFRTQLSVSNATCTGAPAPTSTGVAGDVVFAATIVGASFVGASVVFVISGTVVVVVVSGTVVVGDTVVAGTVVGAIVVGATVSEFFARVSPVL